jgi:nitroreductase
MMLAAHSIGLASCWINREDKMFETEEGKKLLKEWGLPDNLIGIGALSVGYASSYPHTVKPRKEDYFKIIK